MTAVPTRIVRRSGRRATRMAAIAAMESSRMAPKVAAVNGPIIPQTCASFAGES